MNQQDNKFSFAIEALIVVLIMIVWCAVASADEATFLNRGDKTFSTVMYLDQVPDGGCRYVRFYPRPIDKMEYPEPKLYCNTNGAIGQVDTDGTHQ